MINRLILATRSELRNWWKSSSVAVRRAVGIVFDVACTWFICLVPAIVHCVADSPRFTSNVQRFIQSPFANGHWVWALIFSPLPIICLRFVCKVLMRSRTPGEMLCGYSAVSTGSVYHGWLQQIGVAIWQFLLVALSIPMIWLPVATSVQFSMCLLVLLTIFALPIALVVPIMTFFVTLVYWMSLFLQPKNEGTLETKCDLFCRVRVIEYAVSSESSHIGAKVSAASE